MKKASSILKELTMVFVLIGLLIVFAVLCKGVAGRNFLSLANLLNILGQNANLLIIGGFKVLGRSNVLKFLTKLGVKLNGVSLKSGVLVAIVMVALGIVLLAAIILDTLQAESVQKRAMLVAGQDPALGAGAEK